MIGRRESREKQIREKTINRREMRKNKINDITEVERSEPIAGDGGLDETSLKLPNEEEGVTEGVWIGEFDREFVKECRVERRWTTRRDQKTTVDLKGDVGLWTSATAF